MNTIIKWVVKDPFKNGMSSKILSFESTDDLPFETLEAFAKKGTPNHHFLFSIEIRTERQIGSVRQIQTELHCYTINGEKLES